MSNDKEKHMGEYLDIDSVERHKIMKRRTAKPRRASDRRNEYDRRGWRDRRDRDFISNSDPGDEN